MNKYIADKCQSIVNKEFSGSSERRIIVQDIRINIRCPYCHEGKTKNKKRGNVYLDKLFYICFRCDKKTTFDKFCRDFDEPIDPDKKLEMIEHLDSIMTYSDYESDFVDTKLDDLINLTDLERVFSNNLTNITDFSPIKENGGIYKYLIGRGIVPELHRDIYQAKYWRTEDQHEWVIVMLNRRDNKVLGMQVRNLKLGKKRMFKIYNYESLLELVNIGNPDYDPDPSKLVLYNKLSYFFNILNIDVMDTITVFEGYLDSLFYKNSIGLVGVNTDMRFIENNDLDIQYFFDNDDAGYKKSEEKIKSGYRVFLWKKLFDSIVSKKKTSDPHQLLHRISKIKDVNKLFELLPDASTKLNLGDFFSLDAYDIVWIPKSIKKKIEDKDYGYKLGVYKL